MKKASRADRTGYEDTWGFDNPYMPDMYVYNLWSGWRQQDGQKWNAAPPPDSPARFAAAAVAGFTVQTITGTWTTQRLARYIPDEAAWLAALAKARSYLEPDYSVPSLAEFLRQHVTPAG